MKVDDIRAFIPSKNYQESKLFYQALGFKMDYVSDDLSLFSKGECSFFLQNFYNVELATNLMFQLIVLDINQAFDLVSNIQNINVKFEPISQQSWGQVFYLWGPAGELWHITELAS
ncbi:lactoylglutathione lyase [Paraglaciecola sp. 2405UD69-4]|uniref:lactoylglutathione lyase n=1 Tax=Paraglaciecola sp. 2405UD69-4 TaxID=3391836 RepID=UPI0039C9DDD8